jgi:hypothetical protein
MNLSQTENEHLARATLPPTFTEFKIDLAPLEKYFQDLLRKRKDRW